MRIKHSHQKITMTHAQTTCPNRTALRTGKKGVRPAEVRELAPVFEKSVTVLRLKQKLLKCKSTIQITKFNVRTLKRLTTGVDSFCDRFLTLVFVVSEMESVVFCKGFSYVFLGRRSLLLLELTRIGCNVCVFTLCCFLAKFVRQ